MTEPSKSRFGLSANRYRHFLERTEVKADSSVGRNDNMWLIRASGRLLILSIFLELIIVTDLNSYNLHRKQHDMILNVLYEQEPQKKMATELQDQKKSCGNSLEFLEKRSHHFCILKKTLTTFKCIYSPLHNE